MTMNYKLAILFTVAMAALFTAGPTLAHHSSAAYDLDHPLTLQGTVTSFEWSNPHVFIHVDVKDDKGDVQGWRVEGNSPNMLSRVGWNKDMIKAGDSLEVTGAPAKNGNKILRLNSIKLANGQKFDGQGFK
jgi:DNA/RNA endonuclease YhcR with UshA esterase domain